jgi:preprotein translocase subunit SecD
MQEVKKENFFIKTIDILKNPRVIFLIFFIIIALFMMNIQLFENSISINGVTPNSPAENSGMSFDPQIQITNREKIKSINEQKITNTEDYYDILNNIKTPATISIETNKDTYDIFLNHSNNLSNSQEIGISVEKSSKTNIRLGIELEGGSRIILKALNSNLTNNEYSLLVDTLQNRLDIYGASGTKVNKLEDAFSTEKFIIVESISANKNDIFELIKREGNFEAKLGNVTVFTGEDVIRINPSSTQFQGCSQNLNQKYVCSYAFSVEIKDSAAEKFFQEARKLTSVNGQLSERIYFYLDNELITDLSVSSSFRNQKITTPQITTVGTEQNTENLAKDSGKREVKYLSTILSTKSLPSKLELVQSYSISSSLGQKLLENALIIAIAATLIVSSIIALRYRHPGIFIAIFIALITELIIIFGFSAFLKISIDLVAIGGLIAAIGTGVDDQIIITDEYFRKKNKSKSSRKKIKHAIYIIMIAYFTTLAAMIPLLFAGLKILQGFAFMIIIGVSVGVFITRPAYAQMLRIIMTSRAQRLEEKKEEENE